jgi:hypothetical protein
MPTLNQIEASKKNLSLVGIKDEFNRFSSPPSNFKTEFGYHQVDPNKCAKCPIARQEACLEGNFPCK